MSEGKTSAIRIDHLNLRIPGRSVEVGQRVANGIGEHLARQVPTGLRGEFGALNLQVKLAPEASEGEMSGEIANGIMNALQKGI